MPGDQDSEEQNEDVQQDYQNDVEYILYGYYWDIVAQILDVLQEEEITQAELADRMDVSESLISQILNGEHSNFELKTLAKIEVALEEKEWNITLDNRAVELDESHDLPEDNPIDDSSGKVKHVNFGRGDDQTDHSKVEIIS